MQNDFSHSLFSRLKILWTLDQGRWNARYVDCVWNAMAHAQKPGFVFRRNGRVHLNLRGRQFSRLLAAELCASAIVMVVMLDTPCSEVECETIGYPLHSHVSSSLPLLCFIVRHQVSTGLHLLILTRILWCWGVHEWPELDLLTV